MLPIELVSLIANYLDPHDLFRFVQNGLLPPSALTSKQLRTQDHNGDTVLHGIASFQEKEPWMDDIISKYPSVLPLNNQGQSPLCIATYFGHAATVELLLHHGNISDINKALSIAADMGHENVTHLLLQHCANANFEGPYNTTPLYLADASGNPGVVKALLDHGADASSASGGPYPILQATADGKFDIVRQLILAGANVSAYIERSPETPLINAVDFGDVEMVRALLEAGAEVNQTRWLFTALFYAVTGGRRDERLDNGWRAPLLLHDHRYRHLPVVKPLAAELDAQYTMIVKLLLQAGVNVLEHIRSFEGVTAMHMATVAGSPAVVELLINHGGDPFAKTDGQLRPLVLAIVYRR